MKHFLIFLIFFLVLVGVFAEQGGIFSAAGAGTPLWQQQKFWFRDDDGTEITATGFGAANADKDVNITDVSRGAPFRLRFAVKLNVADATATPRLEFKEGTDCSTGSWTVITSTSTNFTLLASPNFADGDPTTKQLVTGPNFVAGKILELTNPASTQNMLKGESTEYEWSLKVAQDTPFGTTYSFRVSNNGAALDTYVKCPTLAMQSSAFVPPSGGGILRSTTIVFSGRAFPNAKISIVDKDKGFENVVSQDILADKDGNFQVNFFNTSRVLHSFAVLVKDKNNYVAQTKFFNINVLESYVLIVKDILVPPTAGLIQRLVTKGQSAIITGSALPFSKVLIEIDDIIKKEVNVEKDGSYKVAVDTSSLEFGTHHARVKQIDAKKELESDYSPTNDFVVSRLIMPKMDLSGDGVINIKDWSVFLFAWGAKDESQKKLIDFNNDGKVNISDFSMFIRAIKK